MRWSKAIQPVPMRRVAVVSTRESLREALVLVADAGVIELEPADGSAQVSAGESARRLQALGVTAPKPLLQAERPDLDALQLAGRADLLAGEAELEERASAAVHRGDVAALAGWAPEEVLPELSGRVASVGAAVVPMPRPRGSEPPTLLHRNGGASSFAPVVETYATVPYEDVDPTMFAAVAYVVMFGLMFGDAGHGLLLVLLALIMRTGRVARLSRFQQAWPFILGAGVVSTLTGVAYGEFFGPTGVLPVRWFDPLEEPVRLLVISVAIGAVLLGAAYALGTVNRVRERGWAYALYSPAGLAGATLFLSLGVVVAGAYWTDGWLLLLGSLIAVVGLTLSFVGLRATAGPGATGVLQAVVELFDVVIRLGANVVSFARLAAFGLTHAAITGIVWAGTVNLWDRGPAGAVAGVLVFLVGNALAFALEALVAGVQALRLEYYELFSRVFQDEGRPFRPWHVPTAPSTTAEEASV